MANAEVALSYVFDELNRLTQTTNHTLTQSIGYEYDDNNNLTRMIGPRGAVEYFYDELNRLVEQRDPVTGVFLYEYDNLGRRTALHYPNGLTTEYSYDVASRLESIITRNDQGEVVDGYSYSYDPVGNRVTMIALHDGVRHEYEYDEVYRLSRWDRGPSRFEVYTYDDVGNRQTLTDEEGITTYRYDVANRLVDELRRLTDGTATTITYTWDLNGNLIAKTAGSMTTSYQWHALDRMLSITGPKGTFDYGYDPRGIRVRETNDAGSTFFLNGDGAGGFSHIVAEYSTDKVLATYYAYGSDIDEPLAQLKAKGVQYLHRDGLGSVSALSSASGEIVGGISYAAFGDVEQRSGARSRHAYASRDRDPTGLDYIRARYYDPPAGRFLSQDQVRGSLKEPSTLHRYIYAKNNPVGNVDPSGHFALPPAVLAGAAYLFLAGQFFYLAYLAYQHASYEVVVPIFLFGVMYATAGVFLLTIGLGTFFPAETYMYLWSLLWFARLQQYAIIVGVLIPCIGQLFALWIRSNVHTDLPRSMTMTFIFLACTLGLPLAS
ncbi:MAG: RHS repeat-associated core domain-containing protein [Proteobacteria bacterium]|nr:RHS repeat-associated core domain-containing protein [Pseudomonadota bacterium]